MKRTFMTLTAAIALTASMTFTSCNKEEQGNAEFTATMETCTDIQGKTVLNGTDLNWVSSDQIAIYGVGGNGVYQATPQTPATMAAFRRVSGSSVSAPCRAYYPATLTTDGVNIILPSRQTYVVNSMNEFPMYAESNTNVLSFRNLCGALKLHLTKANTTISSIAVTASSPINGLFTVDYNNGDPVLTPVSGSATTPTSTNTTVLEDVRTPIDNGVDFFIYLPAGNYTGLEIVLSDAQDFTCTKTANVTIPVTRSQYTTITFGENDIDFTVDNPAVEGALPGLFSVSPTQQVRFSQGNLQYQASTQTWRFAQHQYDYVEYDNNNMSATYTGWIDLFGWGTGNNPTLYSIFLEDYSPFVDWGVNAISNGGNVANEWRTLTWFEVLYLLGDREDASYKYALANVDGRDGLIILPDDWTAPAGCPFRPVALITSTELGMAPSNYLSLGQWADMELAGAVFLPIAGGTNSDYNTGARTFDSYMGGYWTSTPAVYGNYVSYARVIDMCRFPGDYYYRLSTMQDYPVNYGFSVRLVHDN